MARGRIQFLGSGNAFNHDGRGSQSVLIEPGDGAPFLVDLGPTAVAAMQGQGIDPRRLDRLFITHLHGDHVAGWPFLLLHLAIPAGRTRPFEVRGPAGTRRCLEGLAGLCYDDVLEGSEFTLAYREFVVAERRGIDAGDGLSFDTVPMDHHRSSLGYRFHFDGGSVAVSGDTRWCPGLERLAEGSEVLILECTSPEPIEAAHISLREIREGRRRLASPRVLLVHLNDAVAEALGRDPIPGVAATRDGMRLPL